MRERDDEQHDVTDVTDPEELRAHRAKLLASQSLDLADVDLKKPPKNPRADFAIGAIYALYGVLLAIWVFGPGESKGVVWTGMVLAAVAFCVLVMFWRQYSRGWQRMRRSRVYVGKLVEKKADGAVFEGGEVELPRHIREELIPGVRYRVHAPETEDVAVDVALDDEEEPKKKSAYR